MTAPDGAFVIGSGFGQGYTESLVRSMFEVPSPTISSALEVMRTELLKLPLEALKFFEPMIPDVLEGAFGTVVSAVDAIMGALTDGPLWLKLAEWKAFLSALVGDADATVQQAVDAIIAVGQQVSERLELMVDMLLEALGLTPTGIFEDRVIDLSDELDWMKQRGQDVQQLISDLLSNPASILGDLPQSKILGLQVALDGAGQDIRDAIVQALGGSGTGHTAADVLDQLGDWWAVISNRTQNLNLLGALPKGNVTGLITDLDAITAAHNSLINAVLQALRGIPVVGGTLADIISDLGGLKLTATTAQSTADAVQSGVVNGWSGGSTTGADIDVYDTLAAIRAMVGNEGYIRQGFTSSQRWVIPTGVTEIVSIAISSGQNGAPGSDPGGIGGMGGGFKVTALDPATLDALYLQVGTGGNPTRIRNDNASGAILSEAVPGGGGAMSTAFGYTSSSSGAGAGGNGGRGFTTSAERLPGNPGISTPAAVGGAGGIGSSEDGVWGAPGGSVSASAIVPCGGAGGGGGEGGGYSGGVALGNGGRGGDGGFPGGGGGGGGGRGTYAGFNGSQGSGGNGAAGLVILFYR